MGRSEEVARYRALSAREGKPGFSVEERREWDRLGDELHQSAEASIPKPGCCEAMRLHPAVTFVVDDMPDSRTGRGWWRARYYDQRAPIDHHHTPAEASFCPFCGKGLPKMRRKNPVPADVCVINDGGYYCSTCRERLQACICLSPAAAFEPEGT